MQKHGLLCYNSSSIVSFPCSKAPCSFIFHYGNELPKRRRGCSALRHSRRINIGNDSVQREDQTNLPADLMSRKMTGDKKKRVPFFFFFFTPSSSTPRCHSFSVLAANESERSQAASCRRSDSLSVCPTLFFKKRKKKTSASETRSEVMLLEGVSSDKSRTVLLQHEQ